MRDEIKDRVLNGEKSGNVYKHMNRLGFTEERTVLEVQVSVPKSHKQVQNLRQIAVAKQKFSQDEWYNAFVLASQLKDGALVRSLNIFPNLEVTLADPRMIKEYSFLVKVINIFIRPLLCKGGSGNQNVSKYFFLHFIKVIHEGKVNVEQIEPISGTYDDTFNFGPFLSKYL